MGFDGIAGGGGGMLAGVQRLAELDAALARDETGTSHWLDKEQ